LEFLEKEKSGLMARRAMIDRDLVPRGIKDPKVLAAFERVPRHLFIESSLRYQAYQNSPLPIGAQQTISQPYTVALMTQQLELQSAAKVLDIGTGSGYQAAILSRLCKSVYSVERIAKLANSAKQRLAEVGYHNVSVKLGDGWDGWPEFAPYDGIIVAACSSSLPMKLYEQLKPQGRLIIPLGDDVNQELYMFTRGEKAPIRQHLGKCAFVPFIQTNSNV
jgi:protein-L-isoaspartate(D-aspartate) O-methyltransferase